jgi:hypothetical protein
MSHPIVALQKGLVAALQAAPELAGISVFDAPIKDAAPPWIAIARHDVLPRDGDLTPGFEHRLVLQCWAADPSRKAVLGLVSAALACVEALTLSDGLRITHVAHERTDTAIDTDTGRARAALAVRIYSEWVG